jgi:PKD repeat protein
MKRVSKSDRRYQLGLLLSPLVLVACAGGGGAAAPGEEAPAFRLSADALQGEAPLVVNFVALGDAPQNGGDALGYRWDFGVAGASAGSKSRPFVYTEPGRYTASVAAQGGEQSLRAEVEITVLESSRAPDINNRPHVA